MSKTTNRFSLEVRERAVRLVLDNQGLYEQRSFSRHAEPDQQIVRQRACRESRT